jgi:cell division protein FtsB
VSALPRTTAPQPSQPNWQKPVSGSKQSGTVVTLQTVSVAFPKKSLVFGILAAFGLCFLILARYGAMAELNLQIGRMNREYASLKETGRMLQVEIESGLALDAIRSAAREELGMHAPLMNQVISVSVPKSAYSVVADAGYVQQANIGKQSVWNKVAERMETWLP